MNVRQTDMRVVHWEYNELYSDYDKGIPALQLGARYKSETNLPSGFYCRWKYSLKDQGRTYVNVIAEQSFFIDDVKSVALRDLHVLIIKSYLAFNETLIYRFSLVQLELPELDFSLPDDDDLQPLLSELLR